LLEADSIKTQPKQAIKPKGKRAMDDKATTTTVPKRIKKTGNNNNNNNTTEDILEDFVLSDD